MASSQCLSPHLSPVLRAELILPLTARVILAVLFLKYVVFEDPAVARAQTKSRDSTRSKVGFPPPPSPTTLVRSLIRTHPTQRSTHARIPPLSGSSSTPVILSALAYDLPTHPPESLDWLNVLLAQTLSAYRSLVCASTAGNGGARGLMEEMLNRKGSDEGVEQEQGLVGIDRIEVREVEVGDKFPVLSNARVRPSGESGGVVRASRCVVRERS